MMRSLGYVVAEIGPCEHCGRDPGDHTVDGGCVWWTETPAATNVPQPCYRGKKHHAFVDLNDPMPKLGPVTV